MWINNLKIAIVEKNTDNIDKLLDSIPEFKDLKEAESVMYLLKEALELLHTLKDETAESMMKIKKNLNFINSTQHTNTNSLDIKS